MEELIIKMIKYNVKERINWRDLFTHKFFALNHEK